MVAKKKNHRRKSQILDLRVKDTNSEHKTVLANFEESEELNQLYQNKNYHPPEIKQFETIYESSSQVRRGLIGEDGTLKVGKSLGLRFIDFVSFEYWQCDDKEKTRRRRAMIVKQFKGRKRDKIVPLCDEAYHELFELIANKEDTIIESDNEEVENKYNKGVEDFSLEQPGTVEAQVLEESQQLLLSVPVAHLNGVCEEDQVTRKRMENAKVDPSINAVKMTGSASKKTRAQNCKKHNSVQGVVRRSARLQSKADAEEVELPNKRRKTRKVLPSADEEDVFEETKLNSDQPFIQDHLQSINLKSTDNTAAATASGDNSGFGKKDTKDLLHLDEVDEEMNERPTKRKRRSSIYKDLSLSLGLTSGHNICMPAVVRRSLSGEFIPRISDDFL